MKFIDGIVHLSYDDMIRLTSNTLNRFSRLKELSAPLIILDHEFLLLQRRIEFLQNYKPDFRHKEVKINNPIICRHCGMGLWK